MNCGLFVALVLGLIAVGCVNDGDGVAASICSCVRMRDSILLLNACSTLLRRLPRFCLLTIILLVLVSLDVGGLAGTAASQLKRLGCDAIPLGLALTLPLLIC